MSAACPERFLKKASSAWSVLLATIAACSVDPGPSNLPPLDASADGTCTSGGSLRPNEAIHFDGIGDYALMGTAGLPFSSTPRTLSFWYRAASNGGTQAMVAVRYDFASGITLGMRNGALGVFSFYPPGVRPIVATSSFPSAGSWHYFAYVFDGTNSLLYIDGSLVATTSNLPNQLAPASAWLGTTDGNSDMYAGDLDDLRIYRIARTPAEIEADMHGTSGPSEPGLVAYLDFDERCGTRVPDLSPMGNDASLGEGDPARMPTLIESSVPPDE